MTEIQATLMGAVLGAAAMTELQISFVGAVLGALIALFASIWQGRSSLGLESGWRSKIFDACSAPDITLKEVQTLRTGLHYRIHKKRPDLYSFSWFSDVAVAFCEQMIVLEQQAGANRCQYPKVYRRPKATQGYTLSHEQATIFRIICRAILKNHWDSNKAVLPEFLDPQTKRRKDSQSLFAYSFEQMVAQDETLMIGILSQLEEAYSDDTNN